MKLVLGDAFLAPWPDKGAMHLQIVFSNPTTDGKVLVVSMCTLRDGVLYDCKIEPGEHEFAKVESYINFKHTLLVESSEISPPRYKSRDPVSKDLIDRILDTAKTSRRLRSEFLEILENQGLV